MSDLKVQEAVIEAIVRHAKKEAPIEACGYLASKNGVVTKHFELTNVDKSEEHFSFDPKEQFETVKEARAQELDLVAVYHSHPVTPARPSNEDIKLAYDPTISYVIVSLAEGKAKVNSYKISKGNDASPPFPEGDAYDISQELMVVGLKEAKYLVQKEKLVVIETP